ncbi:MAG: two-component system response regulator [Verrucomicrobia bacterium]|nr:two-component system response regulator [Verrucomicrobiota bacterium]
MHLNFDTVINPPVAERPIFLVDDDENDRMLFLNSLHDAGVKNPCRLFATGDEMIEALIDVLQGATPPLVCFLDVKMAGMDGLDVLRWIRLQDALSEVSVVMMSSSKDPLSVSNAFRFGAQCYAGKFPDAPEIREILQEAEKFSAVASGKSSFNVPCNLLRSPQAAMG